MDFNLLLIEERIRQLCNNKGTSINKMLQEAGLRKDAIANIKKGSIPSIDKIDAIANYFDTTTDYLIGRTDNPLPAELHGVKMAAYDGVFDGLNEADIEILKQMVSHLREKERATGDND